MDNEHLRYLEQLSELFPTISRASAEIINLQAILNLPKGTEHFLSDIHGEYEAFSHVLRNGSGAVRKKIDDVFGHTLGTADKSALATLIYYPREKMELVKSQEKDMENWYKITLYRLIEVCKTVSSKYTRSKVRKALPKDFAYVIEELITEKPEVLNKEAYYESIVDTIVELGNTEDFIVALAELIPFQRRLLFRSIPDALEGQNGFCHFPRLMALPVPIDPGRGRGLVLVQLQILRAEGHNSAAHKNRHCGNDGRNQ
mgnify:CR=1 FL=1